MVASGAVIDREIEATFCFVDMAGYTALTEVHGDKDAAELAARFVELAKASLGPGDTLVKTLGDAVLARCATPASAVAFLMALFRRADREPDFPQLRAGLHHGTAVEREGDVFGAAVNLAARVAALAHAGQVLATESVARIARAERIEVVEVGLRQLRNIREPVRVFALATSVVAQGGAVDPVCRIRVTSDRAVGRLRHGGEDYWFCSLACAGAFATSPDTYATRA